MTARLCTTAVLVVTTLAHVATGGELVAEQIFFDDAGNPLPDDLVTVRVYWQADEADDQLVGVVGSPSNPLLVTVTGGTFFDSDHPLAGDRPPTMSFRVPEELSYDSWFTVGNTTIDIGPAWPSGIPFSDEVIVAPGTTFDAGGLDTWTGGPGGPDNVAWIAPPSQEDPGGGGIAPTPQTVAGNWPGNRIALMQLTMDPGPDGQLGTLEGCMGLLVIQGVAIEAPACFTLSFPAPASLTVLALAAMCKRGRRST